MERKAALTWLRQFNRCKLVASFCSPRPDLLEAALKREQKAWELLLESRNTAMLSKEQPRHV